jgi:hypothetical protein
MRFPRTRTILLSLVAVVALIVAASIWLFWPLYSFYHGWRRAPGFWRATGVSSAVVLGLVTAWEVSKPPFNRSRAAVAIGAYAAVCRLARLRFTTGIGPFVTATMLVALGYGCSKFERRRPRLPLLFAAFAATLYVNHFVLSVAFGASRALLASALLVAVWSSTSRILARADQVFAGFFEPARRRTV